MVSGADRDRPRGLRRAAGLRGRAAPRSLDDPAGVGARRAAAGRRRLGLGRAGLLHHRRRYARVSFHRATFDGPLDAFDGSVLAHRRSGRRAGAYSDPPRVLQAAAHPAAQALSQLFDPYVLWVILGSAVFGLFVGAVPGLTATMATALLVPVTFFMPPVPALASIVTATAMAIFAGDIPSCFLRMPGTPASAAYTDEAYAMTKKGQGEVALGAGLVFSVIGGLFGTAVLIAAAPALAET